MCMRCCTACWRLGSSTRAAMSSSDMAMKHCGGEKCELGCGDTSVRRRMAWRNTRARQSWTRPSSRSSAQRSERNTSSSAADP